MKRGLQVQIQLGLTGEEWASAAKFVREFLDGLGPKCDYSKWSRGGWKSSIKRNCYGYQIHKTDLVFRRISKSRRVFGVVRKDTLQAAGTDLTTDACPCPNCQGMQRVVWKDGVKPEMVVVETIGDIKG